MTIRQTVVSYMLEDTPESRKALRNLIEENNWAYFIYEDEKNKLRIENYLDGVMPERVMRAFEKMVQKDPKLKREFELRKRLNDKIIQLVPWIEPLEKAHEKFEKKYKNKEFILKPVLKAEHKKQSLTRWSVAASIALLLGSGLLYMISPETKPSNDELFAEYYEPFSTIKSRSITSANNSDGLIEAKERYKKKDYHNSYIIFSSLPDNINIALEKNFYIGLNLIEMGDFNKAIQYLKSTIVNEFEFLPEAYWYLGLCYIKTGKNEMASETLRNLTDNSEYKNSEVKKILQSLD